MGKLLANPRERKVQKSIAFSFRQLEFFNKYPSFKPDAFCRDKIDEQIALIDPSFSSEDDPRRTNEQ